MIFEKLPKAEERSKKTYSITFGIVFVLLYSGILQQIIYSKFKLSYISEFIITFIIHSICAIILYKTLKYTFRRDIKYFKKSTKDYIKYGISTLIVFGFVELVIQNIIIIFTGGVSLNEADVKILPIIYQLIFGVLIDSFIEECMFRGLIRKLISNKYAYLIVSSVIFGAMHVIYEINNPKNLLFIFVYSIAGFALAYNYEKTDNLVSPIVMHSISNLFSIILSVI